MIVTMMSLTVIQPKCRKCDKTVYLVDQLRADGIVYHKACFRCNHCNGTLKVIHCAWFGAFLERCWGIMRRWKESSTANPISTSCLR